MKNKNLKQKDTTDFNNVTLSNVAKKIIKPTFWTVLVVAGLWSLMHFSTPETKLEPYTKFQKTSAAFENNLDVEVKPKLERFTETKQPDFTNISSQDPEPTLTGNQLPRKTLEHIQKGMQLIEEGKYNSADMEFEKAAQISPNAPEVFALWGTALRVQEKYKGANRHFSKALELSPNDAEIAFNWGVSRFREKATDEAIKLFLKTVELTPSYHMGWYYLGKAYGQKNNYEEEVKSLLKVTTLKPDFGWGHFDLAIALSLKKKFEEAAPHFERAIAIDKKQFEKPFVVQFLTALGRHNPTSPKKEEKKKPEPVAKKAKVDTTQKNKLKAEEVKSEGSDHKMDEGSKMKKATTHVKGTMLINGEPAGSNAIIFLETKTKMKVPNQKTLNITIDQSDLQFSPKHTVAPVGSTVNFSNQDMEVHNIYSKSLNNQFNLGAMSSGVVKTITLLQAGPIVLRCNLHKDMMGTIFAVPNGYFTQPDKQGKYEFNEVKSAGYIMQAWAPHLAPGDVEANLKSADLNGEDKAFDFDIKTASLPGELHDMVDPVDYNAVVDNIDNELKQAIQDWENGKKYVSRKRVLMAITKHYDGGGLKGALAKSFSEKRSLGLEDKLDDIRKIISGIGAEAKSATGDSLRKRAAFAVAQFRVNVKELEARLNPDP
ncbi:MAG: tetratricopeptide repeat protein [Nitrospina sp.]|nr:tetratricopeptide repeat protein [Nitrospina sp.]